MFFLPKPSAVAASAAMIALSFIFSNCSSVCVTRDVDQAAFKDVILSQPLRDSLSANTLCVGMPYSVIRALYSGCSCDTAIAVASSGSRQPLDETEGLYSHFHDPNIQIYLDKYKTPQGTLSVWYGNMNFYRAEIVKNDSVFTYSASAKIDTGIVASLTKAQIIKLSKAIENVSAVPYAEIHSREHIGKISYWYDLSMIDAQTLKQQSQSLALYPILHMELGTTVINSFRFK